MNYKLLKDLAVTPNSSNKIEVAKSGSTLVKRGGSYFLQNGEWEKGFCDKVVESNPEWFEPIYEFKVGDWVITKKDSDSGDGKAITGRATKIEKVDICGLSGSRLFGKRYFTNKECPKGVWFDDIERLATSAEIDSVTKKFPFDYKVNAETYTARECREVQADKVAISQGEGYKCLVFLTETAWKKIGELKGWAL